jgi:L-fuculose-phosphate aldolase
MTPDVAMFERADHSQAEQWHRVEICKLGRQMYQRGYVIACEGNLSVRLDADRILLTPKGACKGDLATRDLLITDLSGEVLCGNGCPSSEMQMHLLYYRSRPDVRAVCHGHPPTATGFAVAGRALEEAILPEVVISLGKVPLAPYGTPGTGELCSSLEPLVSKHDAILLQNHGVVTSGKDLATAYYHMETVEQLARVLLTAELLGGPRLLARVQVQKLIAARPRYGVLNRDQSSELPLTAESLDASVTLKRQELKSFLEESLRKYRLRASRNGAYMSKEAVPIRNQIETDGRDRFTLGDSPDSVANARSNSRKP